ncbi:MAG TPA: hypothetical protein VFQ45_06045, partial [Longimicrobium sp.]|nr:hypothetical protein [Longimicrobium sp.]
PDARVAGGWVAYLHVEQGPQGGWITEVRLRAPGFAGAPPAYSERVSTQGGRALLEALSPDGTVVYRQGVLNGTTWTFPRRYISPRGGPVVDAGPASESTLNPERVIWKDGDFYLLKPDGSVHALSW